MTNNHDFSARMPAHIAGRDNRRSLTADARAGASLPRPPRISIKGGFFTVLNAAGQPVRPASISIDFIIVDVLPVSSRIYYQGKYQEGSTNPPTCFSDNGIGPSANALHPQSPVCESCPNNIRGSGEMTPSGFQTTACKQTKKLAVILADDPQLNIYEFVITPGSLKTFNAHVAWVGRQIGPNRQPMELFDIVTRAKPSTTKTNTLDFEAVDWISPTDEKKVQYIEENNLGDEVVNRGDMPADPDTVSRMLLMRPMGTNALSPRQEAPPASPQARWTPPPRQELPAPPPPAPPPWTPPAQAAPPAAPAPRWTPPAPPTAPQQEPEAKRPVGRPRKVKEVADPVAAGHQAPATPNGFQPPTFVTHGNMQQPGAPPSALDQAMAMATAKLPPKQ